MTMAVTGAAGLLGQVLVPQLLAAGQEVRCLDVAERPTGLDVDWRRVDITDDGSLAGAFDGVDTVFHLAARISILGDRDGRVWSTNVDGAANVAREARRAGVRRHVHCSSVHAFDLEAVDLVTESSPRAIAEHLPVYDRSKAAGEAAVRAVAADGLDVVVVNPTGVIGPFDFERARMSKVFVAMFRRRMPALVHGGFDWVDVRDVVASLRAAAESGRPGEGYLLPGHHASMRELADTVEQVSGVRAPLVTVPMWLAKLGNPLGDYMSRRSGSPLWSTTEGLHALEYSPHVSGAKAAADLGHAPRPLVETVADIRAAAVEQGWLGRAM